jgi:very-short-patch-repair endonuclease
MRTLLRAGQLVAVRRGVYATRLAIASAEGNPAQEHALQVSALRMAVGRDAVASHQSAALIHGLSLLKTVAPGTVTLTRPPRARSRSRPAAGVVFHTAELSGAHVTRVYGTYVTTVARTVVDLARSLPFLDAVVVADSALHGWPVGAELGQVLGACQGWPGIAQARRVAEFGDGRAESVLESAARVVFDAHGLAAPELQVVIRRPGFTFRVDFLWAGQRTVVEADGLTKYSSRADILAQFRRDRLLRDTGYKVVHFTWRELFETPEIVIKRILTAFASPGPF